jgi:endonuclease/exonuclease/phosphatase family metal-dependent hydrolase
MKVIRPLIYILLLLAGAFVIFLVCATVDDYRPGFVETLHTDNQAPALADTAELNLLIWNIGYGGLDASMDFFYDGGKQVRPSKEGVIRNLKGILETLAPCKDDDYILLQEVDRDSRRSYHFDEYSMIEAHFPGFSAFFGMNYNVSFVPVPLKSPMGKVQSGLMTLSRYPPSSVTRHSFPGNYSWPVRLFMLDRCFLVSRYPLAGGGELLVINTHNSAYDDGSLRSLQMSFLREFLLTEYEKGNRVIVGGDWNQTPYGVRPVFPDHPFDTTDLTFIEKDFPAADWTWAYDPGIPTNRRVSTPYDPATTPTTVIDCYLLSPGIRLEHVETISEDFRWSDHNPVMLQVRLLPRQP